MKEVIAVISLFVNDDVDVNDDDDELEDALADDLVENYRRLTKCQYVVVPDDIGDDEYYKLVRKKR